MKIGPEPPSRKKCILSHCIVKARSFYTTALHKKGGWPGGGEPISIEKAWTCFPVALSEIISKLSNLKYLLLQKMRALISACELVGFLFETFPSQVFVASCVFFYKNFTP